jgi:hypothetical protein
MAPTHAGDGNVYGRRPRGRLPTRQASGPGAPEIHPHRKHSLRGTSPRKQRKGFANSAEPASRPTGTAREALGVSVADWSTASAWAGATDNSAAPVRSAPTVSLEIRFIEMAFRWIRP